MIGKFLFWTVFILITGFSVNFLLCKQNPFPNMFLMIALAFGSGAGIVSILFTIWSFIFFPGYQPSIFGFLELVLLVSLITAVVKIKKPSVNKPTINNLRKITPLTFVLGIIFIIALLFAVDIYFQHILNYPYGGWDAWAIWTLKSRYITLSQQNWKNLFSPELSWSHPDYPLFLPSLIADYWVKLKSVSNYVPIFIAGFIYSLTILLFFGALWKSKGINYALIGSTILLSGIEMIYVSANQYADVPLSFLFLASSVLWYIVETERNQKNLPFLLGFFIGLSAWIKNEGIAYLVAFLLIMSVLVLLEFPTRKAVKERAILITKTVVGMLPPLCMVVLVKIHSPVANDLLGNQSINDITSKVFDVTRYEIIGDAVWNQFLGFGSWKLPIGILPIILIFFIINGRADSSIPENKARKQIFFVVCLTFIQYLGIYLITPSDLTWHLDTSLTRLVVQLFPSFLFITLISTRNYFALNSG